MHRGWILAVVLVAVLALPSAVGAQGLATITGTLTDATTGTAPDPTGIEVKACLSDSPSLCVSGSPDVSGHYTIPSVTPGTRFVKVYTPPSYVTQLFEGIPCITEDCNDPMDGTLITIAAGETRTIDFSLTPGGHIAGTVTNVAVGALPYATVSIYNAQTSVIFPSTQADGSGHYDVGGLAAGSYFVVVDFAPSFYSHVVGGGDCVFAACRIASGATVPVSAGATTTVDVALTPVPFGQISGHVTDAVTGAPIAATIQLMSGALLVGVGFTAADGSYTITNVIPGANTATVMTDAFIDPATSVVHPVAAMRTIVVPPGTSVQVDFAVTRGTGSIAGSLVPTPDAAASGTVGSGSAVLVSDRNGNAVKYAQVTFASGSSRWPATYVVSGLSPGTYYLTYTDEVDSFRGVLFGGGGALNQIYGFGPCVAADCDVRRGTPITVTAGGAVTGIDIPVVTAGSIAMTVVSGGPGGPGGLGGPELYDSRGVRVDVPTFGPRPNGLVFLTLPPGTYFLRSTADCRDCAATSLPPIQVQAGERVTLPSVVLAGPAVRITGTIRDSSSMAPLSTIGLVALDTRSSFSPSTSTTQTDMLGQYTVFVTPGTYVVQTSNDRGFVDKASAPITVGTSDVNGVDFVLDPVAGLVLASATDADGVTLTPTGITYFDDTGRVTAHATTSFEPGVPVATSLPPGTYFARTDPVAGRVVELSGGQPCASGTCDPTSGSPITITGGPPATVSFVVPACGAPEVSPALLASAVVGHPYRQVFTSSHPSSGFLVSGGTLPAGMTLDRATGVLAGTPTEGGVFEIAIAAVDGAGCAGIRIYTLQVAQCAFILSPASATVSASGATFDIVASDVCGFASVSAPDSWITVSAASVTSGVPLHVTVAPSTSTTSRSSSLVIGRRVFAVRQPGRQPSPPFGSLDAPADGLVAAGSIAVGGWALDDVEVTHVRIYRDPVSGETGPLVFIGDAVFVDGARPDIEQAYPGVPFNSRAGWGYLLLTNMLPNQGNGSFRLHAIAEDAEGYTTELGAGTIVASNSAATAPFGGIDTPEQGAVISGPAYVNFGWALTPQPKRIAFDGSTIHVLIDGADAGPVTYNNFRSDVSTLFPGLANSAGPVGFRLLDTTALAEGIHTIAWVVTDSASVSSGIGSRYFSVANSVDAEPAGLHAGADFGRSSLVAAPQEQLPRAWSMSALSTLKIDLSSSDAACAATYAGYLVVNGTLRELPAGAALDARGRLTWHPGPAFRGKYELIVVRTDCAGQRTSIPLTVTIR